MHFEATGSSVGLRSVGVAASLFLGASLLAFLRTRFAQQGRTKRMAPRYRKSGGSPGRFYVELTRDSDTRDLLRSYRVIVDGHRGGRLWQGDTIRLPLEPGHHTVQMRYDFFRSKALRIEGAAGEVVALVCRPGPSSRSMLYDVVAGITGKQPMVTLELSSVRDI